MEIKPNDLFKPVKKVIKPYECSLIAAEGPRLVGRWHLEGLQIPFDSQFTSTLLIESNAVDKPIMYGHLGTDITFLAIRAVYGSQQQVSSTTTIIPDKYIEYYYEDDTGTIRTFSDLLILTGNDSHRIPQIYVNNPTDYTAQLHIMAANLDTNVISTKLLPTKNIFTGLYYSSILSDKVNFTSTTTGSTQLEIYNDSNNLILSLEYSNIGVIEDDGDKLIIETDNDESITLQFVSDFHARQAHSRISWVTEDYVNRYLTSESPGIDSDSPVINFYGAPVDTYTGATVTITELQEAFINTIIDNRDGEISKYDTEVIIRKVGSIRNFTEINEQGTFDVTFNISDIATNETTETKQVKMYRSAPNIIFNTSAVANTMYINDTNYYKSDFNQNIINNDDIRNYYIDCVEDYVDTIPKSAVTISVVQLSGSSSGYTSITSGSTSITGITLVGDYEITFSVSNGVGYTDTETRQLKVYTNNFIKPEVLFNSGLTSVSGFTISNGMTESDFRTSYISGITNTDYDTTITADDIVITGILFPTEPGTNTVTFSITNYSGFDNVDQIYRTKTIIVI